jgi:hypothetical protein
MLAAITVTYETEVQINHMFVTRLLSHYFLFDKPPQRAINLNNINSLKLIL